MTGVARPVEDGSAEAATAMLERTPTRPRVALVLGSGLGSAIGADALETLIGAPLRHLAKEPQ